MPRRSGSSFKRAPAPPAPIPRKRPLTARKAGGSSCPTPPSTWGESRARGHGPPVIPYPTSITGDSPETRSWRAKITGRFLGGEEDSRETRSWRVKHTVHFPGGGNTVCVSGTSGVHRSCSLLPPETGTQNRRAPSSAREEQQMAGEASSSPFIDSVFK
jgi:hypothetical protein